MGVAAAARRLDVGRLSDPRPPAAPGLGRKLCSSSTMPTARPGELIGGEQSAAIRVRLNDGASTAPSRFPTRRRARGAAQPDGLERRGARDLRPGCSGARAAGGHNESKRRPVPVGGGSVHGPLRGLSRHVSWPRCGGLSPRVLVRRLTYSNPVHIAGAESSATMAKGGGTRMSEPSGHARKRGCRICSRLLRRMRMSAQESSIPGARTAREERGRTRIAAIVRDARRASRDAGGLRTHGPVGRRNVSSARADDPAASSIPTTRRS